MILSSFIGMIGSVHDLCSDVWYQIFQFFEITELFIMFEHITGAIDDVLYDESNHFLLRGLTLDINVTNLPKQIPLNRIISLTLHETCSLQIIGHCSELRSLKLIGTTEYIVSMTRKISQKNTKLEQLSVIIPTVGFLSELLTSVSPIISLRRLEICADDLVENGGVYTFCLSSSKIEQLILQSSSTINWNDLSCVLPYLINIRLLSISLIDRNQKSFPSFNFQNLRTLSLGLLEVPFNWIVQLVATIPCLDKLKLSGLIDDEGFVINQKWIHLFEAVPTLVQIFVNVFFEQGRESYHYENIQVTLRALNLNLMCNNDESGCYSYYEQQRWWSLKGIVSREQIYV